MAKLNIVLNSGGIRKYLHSEGVKKACKSLADAAADRLGAGYESDTYSARGRVVASVRAESPEAMRENSEQNTIIKAVMSTK